MQQWMQRSIVFGMALLIALVILRHPVATNDGPVHVAFSNQILNQQGADHPLQHLAYQVQLKPNPNLAVYLLMAGLMKVFSASFAESFIQVLCLVGPVLAAYFAIYTIQPKNAWLSFFVLPISFNQMFFLGLYNHCISTAAFFLVIGTYFWMMKAPSIARAAVLAATLVLTFFCHASGFLMSVAGIDTLAATQVLLSWIRHRRILPAVKEHWYTFLASAAPFPLAALFLASGDKGTPVYGIHLGQRIKDFVKLHELAVNFPLRDRFTAMAVSGLLIAVVSVVIARILLNRTELPPQRKDQAIAAMVAGLVSIAIMLVFPDTMGGGWTHFRRFEIFPYFWAILVLAFDSFSTLVVGGMIAVSTSAAIALLISTMIRQAMVREQMAPLAEVDRLIGNHCTVLPIVPQSRPIGNYRQQEWMQYEPYFESASRLELTGDRVVLFNYLARLDAYPVHFQQSVEPQANIFRWKPLERSVQIKYVDINNFERDSGLRVDYILLWGEPEKKQPILEQQVRSAITNFGVIYKSPDGRVTLYERQNGLNGMCLASPPAMASEGVKAGGQ